LSGLEYTENCQTRVICQPEQRSLDIRLADRFPNQINNVLGFPGIFRGALDAHAKQITEEMKLAAAHALADFVKNPTEEKIIPSPLEAGVAEAVAEAVKKVV